MNLNSTLPMPPLHIVLVEDDPDDIELLQEAFKDNQAVLKMDSLKQGDELLPYLENCASLPDVIVLDLNLPKVHGKELLQFIKSSAQFRQIPVVILTTSAAQEEIDFCKRNGAYAFLTKPFSVDGFRDTTAAIIEAATPKQLDEQKIPS